MLNRRAFDRRDQRFSARALQGFAAAKLPEAFSIRAAVEGQPAEILLYDEIGWFGVTAKEFVLALAKLGDGPINLRINSPGGDVFDGMAIHNALISRAAPVNVTIDGIAASAASFIAMAGTTIAMHELSQLMIHNAWGLCLGNRHDMLDVATELEKLDGQMAAVYARRAGKPVADLAAAMDAESFYTSTEAKAFGLCDTVIAGAAAAPAAALRGVPRARMRPAALRRARAELPPYDPDGDGDNDAAEALGLLNSARVLLEEAAEALTGDDDDDDGTADPAMPIDPGARAAATEPEWACGADRGLPIDTETAWDGPVAAERILDDAGYNGNSPDPAKAKRGFLAFDTHNPKLKGSFKLPFADIRGGKLTALKSGLDAAASRLPQTDIPADVRAAGRAVIDAYEKRMDDGKAARLATMRRRLRLAEAEAA